MADNNTKQSPIPVVPRTLKIVNGDGTVTRSGQLLLEQLQAAGGSNGGGGGGGGGTGDTAVTHLAVAIPGTSIATPEFKGDHLSIKMFGAKGDGTTDDSAAIQAAINYSIRNEGCPLHVPAGHYRHNSSINCWGGFRLYGKVGKTLFQYMGVDNAWNIYRSGFTMEGVQIWGHNTIGSGAGSPTPGWSNRTGIALHQCSEYYLKDVFIGGGPAISFNKGLQVVKSGLGVIRDCLMSWNNHALAFEYGSYASDQVTVHNTNWFANVNDVKLQYGTNIRFLENYHESPQNGYYIDNSVTDGFLDFPDTLPQAVAGINDCIFTGTPTTANDIFDVIIDGAGSPDTFKWNVNGGAYVTGVPITGAPQNLTNGVKVNFVFTTGHQVGDEWKASCGQYVVSLSAVQIEHEDFLLETNPDPSTFIPARPDCKAVYFNGGSASNVCQFANVNFNQNTGNLLSPGSVSFALKLAFNSGGAFGPMNFRMKNNRFGGMSHSCVFVDSPFISVYSEDNAGYRVPFDPGSTPVDFISGGGNVLDFFPDFGNRAHMFQTDKLIVTGAGQRMLLVTDNAASVDQKNFMVRVTGGKAFLEVLNDAQTGLKNEALAFFMDTGNVSIGDPATGMLATVWNSFTTYSAGARVIWPTHGYTYFAVSSTTGQQPDLFPAVWIALDHTAVDDGVNAVQIQGPAKVFGKLLVADLITPGNGILGYQPFVVPIIYPSGTSLSGVDTIPLAPLTTSGAQGFIGVNDKGQVVSYQKPT